MISNTCLAVFGYYGPMTTPPLVFDDLAELNDIDTAIAQLQGKRVTVVARIVERGGSRRSVTAEIALERSISQHHAAADITRAIALTTRLPHTLAALKRGDIDLYKASKVVDPTLILSDDLARQVDEVMATRLAGKDPSSIRAAVNRVIQKLDPDGYKDRAQARRRERHIALIHQDETMATLTADLPVEQASAIYTSVDRAARALRRADKTRTLEQLRADVFADRLLAARDGDSSVKADIHVYVDLLTLVGLNEEPAELAGYGAIPAWLARQIATEPKSTWNRLITDPDNGQLLSVGRDKYRPPADLDAFIRVRDRECRTNGCHRPSHFCDVDHTTPWASDGETSDTNLTGECLSHNLVKEEPGWNYTTAPDGTLTITTPSGRKHISPPPAFHEPRTQPTDDAPPF
ncbi:HNH endonuclease signature motif containing protein [Amycolatopsis sp. H20-H5]|uniref:HNH endonuclease signature motif containing protein n=1 Tax=Amycolatopsis sp. H20-H5 TaxID=3046309 RepID=UPI002DB7609C|nr:DUF222 domain-containing protein [Amycolatopsis sp. H20-H5]MEC3981102.1 DUF222 domain-containing protein [Amycolatopsis sp. H20-H5]